MEITIPAVLTHIAAPEKALWTIYNIIREIEYSFRVLKTDLDLLPIYHKTDSASMAHLHLGILVYWLVATTRYQLKKKGIHSDWRELVRMMNTQKCVTISVVNIRNEVRVLFMIRNVSVGHGVRFG